MNTTLPQSTAPAVPDKSAIKPPKDGRIVFLKLVVDYSTEWEEVLCPPGFDEPDQFANQFAHLSAKDERKAEVSLVLLDMKKTGRLPKAMKWAAEFGLVTTVAREVSAIGHIKSKDLPHQLREKKLFVSTTTSCQLPNDTSRLFALSLSEKKKFADMFRVDNYGALPDSWFVFRIPIPTK